MTRLVFLPGIISAYRRESLVGMHCLLVGYLEGNWRHRLNSVYTQMASSNAKIEQKITNLAVSYCFTVKMVSSMVLLQSVLTDDTKKFNAKISC